MIEVKTVWIPQIIAYAEIVSDRETLRDCWTLGRCVATSVTSFDEMIEQIFGDLDSDNLLEDARRDAALPEEIVKSISGFLVAIKEADQAKESGRWADRGGSVCLNSLAGSLSGLPAVDHAAARSGWLKYSWSGVRRPRLECGLTLL